MIMILLRQRSEMKVDRQQVEYSPLFARHVASSYVNRPAAEVRRKVDTVPHLILNDRGHSVYRRTPAPVSPGLVVVASTDFLFCMLIRIVGSFVAVKMPIVVHGFGLFPRGSCPARNRDSLVVPQVVEIGQPVEGIAVRQRKFNSSLPLEVFLRRLDFGNLVSFRARSLEYQVVNGFLFVKLFALLEVIAGSLRSRIELSVDSAAIESSRFQKALPMGNISPDKVLGSGNLIISINSRGESRAKHLPSPIQLPRLRSRSGGIGALSSARAWRLSLALPLTIS